MEYADEIKQIKYTIKIQQHKLTKNAEYVKQYSEITNNKTGVHFNIA